MKYKKGTFIVVPNHPQMAGKPSEMQVAYMWLCSYADKDGLCFPSRKTLAKNCGCDIRTVDKYLKQLIDDGFISKSNRKVKGSKQNLSNLYQLLLVDDDTLEVLDENSDKENIQEVQELHQDGVEKNTRGGAKNDIVTISNSNSIHLTKVLENGQLPLIRGKTYILRVLSIYKDLFRDKYNTEPTIDIARFGKALKSLMQTKTELQVAALLVCFFNWHGITGYDQFENDKLLKATFNPFWFFSTVTSYEIYLRNVFGLDLDDELKVKEFVATSMTSLK